MAPQKFGRYKIKSELGRGGMATVFHAYDPRFQRDVALKVLPREFLHDPTFKARFEREAQTIAALEHPAIVPVYDFGEEQGQPYLVMRFLPGGTLDNRLQAGGLPLNEAAHIIYHLAPALDEAHERGIIHRDLKPANILFDQRDFPFITDFGIAKLTAGGKTITTGQVIVGTPAYMSPEQASGEKVDGRTDIYALGVILFEMLTGKLPFNAETPVGLLMKHLTEPVPDILQIRADLPPACKIVIAQALAKHPSERYDSASTLATAFSRLVGGGGGSQPEFPGMVVAPLSFEGRHQQLFDSSQEAMPTSAPAQTPGVQQLACPSCGAPLPPNIAPNQLVECNGCGTRLMLTKPEREEPIVCPNCQTVNAEEMRFCSNCGQQIRVDCVQCHTQNPIDATHCSKCGTNLKQAQARREELLEAQRRLRLEREQVFKAKELRQQQAKIERLIEELSNPAKQDFALYQLGQLGDAPIQALIDSGLTHPGPHARYASAKLLGQICEDYKIRGLIKARVVKALIKALDDSESAVRYWAAEALGKFKGQPGQLAVEPLGILLRDKNEEVRQQAQLSLQNIGGERAREILDESKGFMGWLKG